MQIAEKLTIPGGGKELILGETIELCKKWSNG
jgi:hypothetical protein